MVSKTNTDLIDLIEKVLSLLECHAQLKKEYELKSNQPIKKKGLFVVDKDYEKEKNDFLKDITDKINNIEVALRASDIPVEHLDIKTLEDIVIYLKLGYVNTFQEGLNFKREEDRHNEVILLLNHLKDILYLVNNIKK